MTEPPTPTSPTTEPSAPLPSAPAAPRPQRQLRRMLPFLGWLAAFYTAWLTILTLGHHWGTVAQHWPMALAMLFGSYFAGSTPMGGGTVGFPFLVLLFGQPATLGRDFSFAVQSIGMVSASIFILCRRQPLEWPMLRAALLGTTIGTPLGLFLVAPHANDLTIKLTFAVIWASFGLMHFVKLAEIARQEGMTRMPQRFDHRAGFLIGLCGGATVASVTGVGIDLLIYAVLVLISRADLKIAVPTSVILMAWTSLLGIATRNIQGGVDPAVLHNWLAAAPVVALGAPFGAFIVGILGRKASLMIVSVLCVGQFAWTCQNEWARLGWIGLGIAIAGVLACNAAFHLMYVWGKRLARTHDHADTPHEPST